jgi:hypothetical protein
MWEASTIKALKFNWKLFLQVVFHSMRSRITQHYWKQLLDFRYKINSPREWTAQFIREWLEYSERNRDKRILSQEKIVSSLDCTHNMPVSTLVTYCLIIFLLKNHEELRGLILFLHSNFIFGRKGLSLDRYIYNISLVKKWKRPVF